MKVNRAYRYELKPNVEQRILLAKHAGCARFAYNWGLGLRIQQYEHDKSTTNAIAQHKLLNSLKATEFPWMYDVSKCAAQEALRDLDRAYRNFFQGQKTGQNIGFPKFKKKGDHDSFRLTGTIRPAQKAIQLPRLGTIRLKEIPLVQGDILSATVSREVDRWFVSIAVEVEQETVSGIKGDPVGIDLGLTDFATLSTGEKIKAPRSLSAGSKHFKKLKRLSKQHSRKQKGSKNRKKSAVRLGRKHRKIGNIRKDFHHKFSTSLAKTKSVIVVETLNVKGMLQNRRLARHISDAGWTDFRRMLAYKTVWYGSKLVLAPAFYASSKICHACKAKIDQLPLSVREWKCEQCSTVHDRDITAAKNLLNYYTESSSGINACGDTSDGTGKNLLVTCR